MNDLQNGRSHIKKRAKLPLKDLSSARVLKKKMIKIISDFYYNDRGDEEDVDTCVRIGSRSNYQIKDIFLDTCVGIWRASAMLCQLKLSSRASKAPCTPDSIRLLA